VSVPANGPLHQAIRSESPRLVLVNASADGAHAARTAEAIRSDKRLVQPRLVAVLEAPAPDEAGRLATAGFDAVLTKPIRCSDLERLLRSQAD
jgi:CheY-like chemotaxis protein